MHARQAWERIQPPTKSAATLLWETAQEFSTDNAGLIAAGIAFYAVLSLAPLLVLLVVIAGTVYGQTSAREQITAWVHQQVGGEASQAVIDVLNATSAPGAATLPGLLSLALMFWGASGLFHNLQRGLNVIWNVRPKDTTIKKALRQVLRKRILTFLLLLGLSLLFLLSLGVDALLPLAYSSLEASPGSAYVARGLSFVLWSGAAAVGVGLVYRILPDVRIPWRFVRRGAMVTGVLLVAGKLVLAWYLQHQSVTSAYGAAGSVVALLLWVHFSVLVFLFGAEFTEVYARRRGVPLEPAPYAEFSRRPSQ